MRPVSLTFLRSLFTPLLALFLSLYGLWIWLTPLAFIPVPWPDASAFALPGVDLWKSAAWKMSSIREFIPSYETANFQIMPGLSVVLGFLDRLGASTWMGGTAMTRGVSLLMLLLGAFYFARRAEREWGVARLWSALFALTWVSDPILRWGTLVVRTEVVVGAVWLYVLFEISRRELRPLRIGGALGIAALFHFNAVTWVVPTALGIALAGFERTRNSESAAAAIARNYFSISLAALTALSPWLVYVALHFPLFVEQMTLQFARLDQHVGTPIQGFYSFFHSLWPTTGSPAPHPKMMNLAKGIFWALSVLGIWMTLLTRGSRLIATALAGFVFAVLMYWDKPEPWFATLAHTALWGMALVLIRGTSAYAGVEPRQEINKRFKPSYVIAAKVLLVASLALHLASGVLQARAMPQGYQWKSYRTWVDCLVANLGKPPLRIWQPYAPDALVDIVSRDAGYDVTRTPDVPIHGRELEIASRHDALILSTERGVSSGHEDYSGPLRDSDRALLARPDQVPHAPLAAELGWPAQVCHFGAFWAAVYKRVSP